nr:aspartate aminotransferase family protein [uncultured Acetobacterium sp.]
MNKYKKSIELLKKARELTPLGAQTYSRSFRYYGEGYGPSFIERGKGSRVWDIDGNEYIDFVCALGPITIGYNDERVNEAIIKQLEKGIIFSQPSPISIELAEKLVEIIPCAEMVRFVKNGSDATEAAVRLARAYTGKDIIVVCGYHGMHDWYIGSTANHRGIPEQIRQLTKNVDYNNIDALEQLLCEYKGQIAGIILEPIQGNGPDEGYLQKLREITQKNSVVLIFDEVVSGFRYVLGGASELYNVSPDLIAFGKGMANGMPISAVAGKKEIVDLISEGVFVSTTFGDETLSMAAALKTIEILVAEKAFDKFWSLGKQMQEGIQRLILKNGLEEVLVTHGLAPHQGLVFNGINDLSYLEINSIFQQKMLTDGILSLGINNINLSHSKDEIEAYLTVADMGMCDIKKAIENNSTKNILKGGKIDPIFKR